MPRCAPCSAGWLRHSGIPLSPLHTETEKCIQQSNLSVILFGTHARPDFYIAPEHKLAGLVPAAGGSAGVVFSISPPGNGDPPAPRSADFESALLCFLLFLPNVGRLH